MTKSLRLGVIGLSEGNGHPYSWSAIFNGYVPEVMGECGFPTIPDYLSRQSFPEDAIAEARVTHVWAQSRTLSEHVAQASRIDHVVDHLDDMIGRVDAVLLARDDAQRHTEFATPFLEAGLPIYIDKPIALTVADAARLYDLQQYDGQIFTCSALRYAPEFRLSESDREALGPLRCAQATAPKDWERYAVHLIEPTLAMIGPQGAIRRREVWREADSTVLTLVWESGMQATFSTLGSAAAPMSVRLVGSRGHRDMVFSDPFAAFKAALQDFVGGVIHRDVRTDPGFVFDVVRVIEAARAA